MNRLLAAAAAVLLAAGIGVYQWRAEVSKADALDRAEQLLTEAQASGAAGRVAEARWLLEGARGTRLHAARLAALLERLPGLEEKAHAERVRLAAIEAERAKLEAAAEAARIDLAERAKEEAKRLAEVLPSLERVHSEASRASVEGDPLALKRGVLYMFADLLAKAAPPDDAALRAAPEVAPLLEKLERERAWYAATLLARARAQIAIVEPQLPADAREWLRTGKSWQGGPLAQALYEVHIDLAAATAAGASDPATEARHDRDDAHLKALIAELDAFVAAIGKLLEPIPPLSIDGPGAPDRDLAPIDGKVAIVQRSPRGVTLAPAFWQLPPERRALDASGALTIVWVEDGRDYVGSYSTGGSAYRLVATIRAAAFPGARLLGGKRVLGGEPPEHVMRHDYDRGDSVNGTLPDTGDAMAAILALPKR